MASVDVDWSQPIAALLKAGTAAAHDKAEHSEGAGWLTRGELDKDEYIRFLMMLYHVYDIFERGLDRHATHPVLAPTYNPTLFARTPSISADIAHLLQVPEGSWQAHSIHTTLLSAPPAPFARYTERLQHLADTQSDVPRLLAHAYVRYLGDLSGGQFIRRRITQAYELEDGAGVSFYDFKRLGGTESGSMGDMKKIKEWYRDGMNAGVQGDVELKKAILNEANVAFELNSGLFTILRSPTTVHPTDLSAPSVVLGEPITPIEEDMPSKEGGKVVYDASQTEKNYTMSSVIAFIMALCLSHFILVVGGFTGDKGYSKLQAILQWLSGLLPASK